MTTGHAPQPVFTGYTSSPVPLPPTDKPADSHYEVVKLDAPLLSNDELERQQNQGKAPNEKRSTPAAGTVGRGIGGLLAIALFFTFFYWVGHKVWSDGQPDDSTTTSQATVLQGAAGT